MADDIRNLAEQDPHVIRQQIDVTRASITEKLEALEEQVVGTVQHARESVTETIETVKEKVQETVGTVTETVEETVTTVKEALDLRLQVQRHPWPMMGASFLVGLVAGTLVGESRRRGRIPIERLVSHGEIPLRSAPPPESARAERPAPREPGLRDRFRDEIDQLKSVAIGMALGVARDFIKEAVQERMPQLADQIEDVIDRVTTKLGGKPVQGPVLHDARTEMSARS
jgi:ElaB/YqjD/DUF883 family membrane-anchored ribosome-binding protein